MLEHRASAYDINVLFWERIASHSVDKGPEPFPFSSGEYDPATN
jgi:hypothetical protein